MMVVNQIANPKTPKKIVKIKLRNDMEASTVAKTGVSFGMVAVRFQSNGNAIVAIAVP